MKLLEVHVIQTVAPSNLNRDDTGSPKDALFGGFRRARISSQAQKRVVRSRFKEHFPEKQLAVRTRKLVDRRLMPELQERDPDKGNPGRELNQERAARVARNLLSLLKKESRDKGGEIFKKDSNETTYLLFLAEAEVDELIELALQNKDVLMKEKLDKKERDQLREQLGSVLKGAKAVDIALFGRMLADQPEFGVDAAVQVAHALSTHKVDREFDFYTAVDDLNPKEETGAGMMGDVEFYSATLYRYAALNLDLLLTNLRDLLNIQRSEKGRDGEPGKKQSEGEKELAVKLALYFLEAFALTLPSGKQNAFAAHNPPLFVAFRAGEGLPRNLATAFEKPLRPREDKALSALSVEALAREWARFDRAFGPLNPEWKGALNLTEGNAEGLPSLENFSQLKERVKEALEALLGG